MHQHTWVPFSLGKEDTRPGSEVWLEVGMTGIQERVGVNGLGSSSFRVIVWVGENSLGASTTMSD